MESPKTGIVLLALVAVATATGGLLGWTLRAQGTPGESVKFPASMAPEMPVVEQETNAASRAVTRSTATASNGAPGTTASQ